MYCIAGQKPLMEIKQHGLNSHGETSRNNIAFNRSIVRFLWTRYKKMLNFKKNILNGKTAGTDHAESDQGTQ